MTVIMAAHHSHLHVSAGAFLVGIMVVAVVIGRALGGSSGKGQ